MAEVPSLAVSWGTVQQAGLPEFLETAAQAGFDGVHLQPYQLLHNDLGGPAGVARRCADLGLTVDALDPLVRPLPGAPDPASLGSWMRRLLEVGAAECFELAVAVGARTVNVTQYGCAPSSIAVLAEVFARLCDQAADAGLELAFEFMPAVSDVASPMDAAELLALAGNPAVGRIMLDTWHLYRGGWGAADVRALPAGLIGAAQINDARLADHDDPREPPPDRLLPGEGAIPVAAVLAPVLAWHPCRTVAVEVFSRHEMSRPAIDVMRAAAERGRAALDEAAKRSAGLKEAAS
jgi:sugar phosphate isomerase/epimerase